MINKNRLLLIVWIAVIVASAIWVAKNVKVNSDLGQFMPQDDSIETQLMLTAMKSGPGTSILMISLSANNTSTGVTNVTPQQLARANKKLARQFRTNQRIRQVINGELKFPKSYKRFIVRYHWLLNPELNANTFSQLNINARMQYLLSELRSPAPLIDKSLVPVDPLGSIPQVLKSWASKIRPTKKHGVWFSRDGKQSLLFLHTRAGGFEINKQQELLKDIYKSFDGIKAKNVKLTISGPGFYAVEYRRIIRQDIVKLSIAALLFVSLLLIVIYRSITPLGLASLPLVTAVFAGIISVTLVFGSIHGITLAFGVTLVGVTIDYPIHLFTHLREPGSALKTMRGVWPTLRLGVLTTGVGFMAMLLAGFEGLKQLAVFAIAGLFIASLTTRYLLPRVVNKKFRYQSWAGLEKLTDGIVKISARLPLFIAILVGVALVWLISRPQLTNHDPKLLTPLTQDHRRTDQQLRKMIGTSDTRFLMTVSGQSVEQVLQTLEKIEPELSGLVSSKKIGSFTLVSRYLPSIKEQKRRQLLMPITSILKNKFNAVIASMPFKAESFEAFYKNVETARTLPPFDRVQALKSPLYIHVGSLLQKHKHGWMALVPLQQVADRKGLIEWGVKLNMPGVRVTDIRLKATNAIKSYSDEAIRLIGWGSLVILTMLWIGLRSIREMLRVALPIVGALILTVATWNIAGVQLNIFHLVSLLLVVGIGIDYALFFIRRTEEQEHHLDYLAVSISNLTTVVVFGFLFFAYPLVLQAVGGTVAMGALYAYIISASVATRTKAVS